MSIGYTQPQRALTIEQNMEAVDSVEGLDIKAMYATIATAQMMYEQYKFTQELKHQVLQYEELKANS